MSRFSSRHLQSHVSSFFRTQCRKRVSSRGLNNADLGRYVTPANVNTDPSWASRREFRHCAPGSADRRTIRQGRRSGPPLATPPASPFPDGAALLVVEQEFGPANERPNTKFSYLNMLMGPGGRESSTAVYAARFTAAGNLSASSPSVYSYTWLEWIAGGSPIACQLHQERYWWRIYLGGIVALRPIRDGGASGLDFPVSRRRRKAVRPEI